MLYQAGRHLPHRRHGLRTVCHRRNLVQMSKPVPIQPTRPSAAEVSDSDAPVTPEVERVIRERLETFDEDAKAARPWEDVLADLKARRPLPPSPR